MTRLLDFGKLGTLQNRFVRGRFLIFPRIWILLATLGLANPAVAQLAVRVLHSFGGANDGQQPYAGLVQASDGALYGTTFQGGANNAGTLFKVQPDGSGNAPLYSFPASQIAAGGIANPSGLIQGLDGKLYGTIGFGGTYGYGVVFAIQLDGTGFFVLHNFDAGFNGPYEPAAPPVQGTDGYLYGTTQGGGGAGRGCIYKLDATGTGYATIHEFGIGPDGQSPQSPLIQASDGSLYGTTALGGTSAQGGASGFGTVFRLGPDGSGETILHNFSSSSSDGKYPYTAGLVQGKDGPLYGVTQQGGSANAGTVFKLNLDGTGFVLLHEFSVAAGDGKYPNSTLVLGTDGFLYGATEMGGANNSGTIFRVNSDGSAYSLLYSFGTVTGDGAFPAAPLVQASDGGLFGTTKFGGLASLGTVFRLAPGSPLISSVVAQPDSTVRLIVDCASNFVYRIDGTTDHVHWAALANLTNSSGSVRFTDNSASSVPQKYYRAVWVP